MRDVTAEHIFAQAVVDHVGDVLSAHMIGRLATDRPTCGCDVRSSMPMPCEYHFYRWQYEAMSLAELELLAERHPLWEQDPYIRECDRMTGPHAEAIHDLRDEARSREGKL